MKNQATVGGRPIIKRCSFAPKKFCLSDRKWENEEGKSEKSLDSRDETPPVKPPKKGMPFSGHKIDHARRQKESLCEKKDPGRQDEIGKVRYAKCRCIRSTFNFAGSSGRVEKKRD